MPIDAELLSILVCPETHQPLAMADEAVLAALNARVEEGGVRNRHGDAVKRALEEALVREDGKALYVIEDGIPNLLIDERIDL